MVLALEEFVADVYENPEDRRDRIAWAYEKIGEARELLGSDLYENCMEAVADYTVVHAHLERREAEGATPRDMYNCMRFFKEGMGVLVADVLGVMEERGGLK